MVFGPEDCDSLDRLLQREWLETDGLGNWASSTASGVHTRRFHGWLAAEERVGSGHRLLLSKIEETVFVAGERYELGANCYPDTIHPQGYRYLVEFRVDPWPLWRYELGALVLERELLMLHGAATTLVVYRAVSAPCPVALELRPLVAGRGVWSTETENPQFSRRYRSFGEQLEMAPYAAESRLVLTYPQGRFSGDGFWFYNFLYSHDLAEGVDGREDLFNPGMILCTLQPGEQRTVAASTAPLDGLDLEAALATERERRAALVRPGSPLFQRLLLSADQYVVQRRGRPALVPCYPGGGERLLERLRAVPGLTLPGGRVALAEGLLSAMGSLLPADDPLPALWYAWSLGQVADAGGGESLWAPVVAVAESFCGTDGPDALGAHALWHHALCRLAERPGCDWAAAEAQRAAETFAARWSAADDRLCWLVVLALTPCLLTGDAARARLAAVRAALAGRHGVRASAAEPPAPGWLGLLGEALLTHEPDGRAQALALLEAFPAHLREGALGHVGEGVDDEGEASGCMGHAVAVGELLRLVWRLGA